MCALDAKARGGLAGDAVVVTVMTNLGFRRAMDDAGIHIVDTKVGDRHVLEALDAGGIRWRRTVRPRDLPRTRFDR